MENISNLSKFWKKKKVFITGHTGFKGSWLVIILNFLGAKIYGYSLKPLKKSLFNMAECKKLVIKSFYHDIKNKKKLEIAIQKSKPDVIFHFAAQSLVKKSYEKPYETFSTNIIGTLNLLEVARKTKSLKSLVIATTDKVYENNNKNKAYGENDKLGGTDPYSSSKVCKETLTKSFINTFFNFERLKYKVSTVRSGNVIGGGDFAKDRLFPDVINSLNFKKKLILRNPGHIRPWQHVIEPIYGYLLLSKLHFKKNNYNKNYSWNFGPDKKNFVRVIDIVRKIRKKKNIKIEIKKLKKIRESKTLKLNNFKSKKLLKWHPRLNIDKSINMVLEWNDLIKYKKAKELCVNQIKKYFSK